MKVSYYKYLDIFRIVLCLVVLLYHLNILPGGYLAVCSFFVLSGYLSCISAIKKEKFSLSSYYFNKFVKLYLPLIATIFITILITNQFDNITWLSLKPETTSAILGYNNFWQISANMNYFSHHINSPFIHLWYISILFQFDLIFPFIYIILKKLGDKLNEIIPCIILIFLTIGSTIYFYLQSDITVTYYNTFTRIFSLLFGLTLGFIHIYFEPFIFKIFKKQPFNKIIFFIYLILLSILFIYTRLNIEYFHVSMVLVTLITCRIIDYGVTVVKEYLSNFDKFIKNMSSMTYEIYLLQYPIIFFIQYIGFEQNLQLPLIIGILIATAFILWFAFNNYKKFMIVKVVLSVLILTITVQGGYHYYYAKDYTEEMKKLEEQLVKNELEMKEKQQDYEQKFKKEQEDFNKILEEIETNEGNLENFVTNLNIVGVGDSVMLGALPNLYTKFPNSYFDAQISRTAWVVSGILKNLKNKNMLGNPIVLNLGANGDCPDDCKRQILNICENREVFWLNVTNDREVNVNNKLWALEKEYKNLHIIDWNFISYGHSEYFLPDKIHLTEIGKVAYADAIYKAIYDFYYKLYEDKKNEVINNYEEQFKTTLSFYGNDILINVFDNIKDNYKTAKFVTNSNFSYELLKQEIQNSIDNKTITKRIVLAFDDTIAITNNQYEELINMCSDSEIYILSTNDKINNSLKKYESVTIIDFYEELKNNKDYLMADKVHLTNKGNVALSNIIKGNI